jgi:hypothetical protein
MEEAMILAPPPSVDIELVPSCTDPVPYEDMDYEQLFQVAATGDQQALAELDRRLESEPRQLDYDYELRHPGHGDQSVHNPHKGGAAAGPGAFVPGKWVEQPQLSREEHLEKVRASYTAGFAGKTLTPEAQAHIDSNVQQIADLTYPSEVSHVTYKNGPVSMRVDKSAAVPLTPEMQARMDKVTADVQAKYPGQMDYEWTNLEGTESNAIGASRLGSRYIAFDSAKMETNKDVGNGLEHTVWHETGHALPMKGAEDAPGGFQILPEVEGTIDGYALQVASKYPREFSIGYISEGPSGNLATMISRYATKDKAEMHAEIFALFHNPQPNTGKFKQDVINEYGKAAGWKP